jgi:demethylmenaquinone methyltransferase/2-methoxy-6-polyprenyl-1,4-benzoquinol methylase
MSGFDHFNVLGPIYDYIFGRSIDENMVKIAAVKREHCLLDVGGGTGRVSVLFHEITDQVVIADSAIKMLREAQNKALRTVNGSSEHLPFKTGIFDRVIMVDALHHVKDQEKTLEEIWRVLAHGGRMVIEEPDINHFLVKLVALGEKIALMRSRFIAPEQLMEMCRFEDLSSIQLVKRSGIAWVIMTKEK